VPALEEREPARLRLLDDRDRGPTGCSAILSPSCCTTSRATPPNSPLTAMLSRKRGRGEPRPYNAALCKEIHMAESTITSKGQTTVPADIRALVHAKPGTRLVWSVMPDGTIIVRAKTKSILDMAGMLEAPKGKRVSVEEMNPWR
jgi:AbrB family looped-hinge helix DNA binding protein